MHSSISVIRASGLMITVSMMLCDGAHVRTSAFTAADSANRIAHAHGTISATNIARIADTASHESSCTGHSTMHNGIDTYRNIIITLSSTFIHNSAMNTIAERNPISTTKISPSPAFSANAPVPTTSAASNSSATSCCTDPLPSSAPSNIFGTCTSSEKMAGHAMMNPIAPTTLTSP